MSSRSLEIALQQKLDDKMQEGYNFALEDNSIGACGEWSEVWKDIVNIMKTHGFEYIEDMDAAFHGTQSIYNWSADFEIALDDAARRDISFAQARIDFCSEYISMYRDKDEFNLLTMRAAIGESYYQLGKNAEGDQAFKKCLEEYPTWGWGWIGWSDQYWDFGQEQNKNSEKAIQILKQALEVKELEDRFDVLKRLCDLYAELEMEEEAADIRNKIADLRRQNLARHVKGSLPPMRKAVPVISTKIGRNDPCTCGSGQKYKKCCGK
ncbi:SEC-C metal-binding domain-containing protein [Aneurinibacillus tyrosinisolvens]|uniref:SEC-C metal-binding domain-containing protein n=1 Tax=Aneurinibacillus tyrosinisolvens TaxID=1443435 RepID=UPI00063FC192|nr:SEC-C metal-binding domain-containing protein [Aneurinibacillus tyrosinisolvens]